MTARVGLVGAVVLLSVVPPVAAQDVAVSVSPGYAYSFQLKDGGGGATLSALVVRTRTISVGGEVGYFSLGSWQSSFEYWDPVFGGISSTQRLAHDYWVGAAVARYAVDTIRSVKSHAILSTGLYRFLTVDSYEERGVAGSVGRMGPREYESSSVVPGIGVGFAAELPLGWEDWGADIELRVHTLLGAAGSLYPVATLTVGLGSMLRMSQR